MTNYNFPLDRVAQLCHDACMTNYDFHDDTTNETVDIRTLSTEEQDAWYHACGEAGDWDGCETIRSIRPDLRAAYELTLPE